MQKLATQGQQMESKTFPFMDLLNEYDHFFLSRRGALLVYKRQIVNYELLK